MSLDVLALLVGSVVVLASAWYAIGQKRKHQSLTRGATAGKKLETQNSKAAPKLVSSQEAKPTDKLDADTDVTPFSQRVTPPNLHPIAEEEPDLQATHDMDVGNEPVPESEPKSLKTEPESTFQLDSAAEFSRNPEPTVDRLAKDSGEPQIDSATGVVSPASLSPGFELDSQLTKDTEATDVLEAASVERALQATKKGIWGRIQALFGGGQTIDMESLEEVLYTSDLGPRTVQHLMSQVEAKLGRAERSQEDVLRQAIKQEMLEILNKAQVDAAEELAGLEYELMDDKEAELKPIVWMMVGVNGAGKTTSIGKLANLLASRGKTVMLAAGDTFRAAADAQLKVWSQRAGVELFSPEQVKDPSAVAFDACKSAVAKNFDHVIVDTAGRLHTQNNLMEELKKMKRVIEKAIPGAPHEVLLVIDANNGQNALIQAREFHQALGLTGVILTKMDGSAKGGVVLGVAHEIGLPIKRIGIGEKIEDLRLFNAQEFVDAIL